MSGTHTNTRSQDDKAERGATEKLSKRNGQKDPRKKRMTTCEDTFLRARSLLQSGPQMWIRAEWRKCIWWPRGVIFHLSCILHRSFTFPALRRQFAVVCSYLVLWFSICLVFHQRDVQFFLFVVFCLLLLCFPICRCDLNFRATVLKILFPCWHFLTLVSPLYQDQSKKGIRHNTI